jgi:hypothetical protein
VADLGKTSAGHQTDIACSNDCDVHDSA